MGIVRRYIRENKFVNVNDAMVAMAPQEAQRLRSEGARLAVHFYKNVHFPQLPAHLCNVLSMCYADT